MKQKDVLLLLQMKHCKHWKNTVLPSDIGKVLSRNRVELSLNCRSSCSWYKRSFVDTVHHNLWDFSFDMVPAKSLYVHMHITIIAVQCTLFSTTITLYALSFAESTHFSMQKQDLSRTLHTIQAPLTPNQIVSQPFRSLLPLFLSQSAAQLLHSAAFQ